MISIVLILLFPFLSFFCLFFFGVYLGKRGSFYLSSTFMFISLFLSLIYFLNYLIFYTYAYVYFGEWIEVENLKVSWSFIFDSLALSMCFVVNFISFVVHIYSYEYMSKDPHIIRFFAYLSLFTFFMLILVCSSNFVLMFLGWEGVGVCSFLLISFWYTRDQAVKSALKAIILNRFGDFGLSFALLLLYYKFGSFEYSIVFSQASLGALEKINFLNCYLNVLSFICFFIFIGVIGKSAQLGLHVWLPDAMEGPTPVSALIHAATMVTAGVFLLIRTSHMFEFCKDILYLVSLLGALTSFFSGTIALFQNDIKKIIAYSTCSQLGYMILACGCSAYNFAFFHLFNHAFFKALLFLGAGSIIHSLFDEQDIRKMGGLRKRLRFTYRMMMIGSFSLVGFPFFSGFYSKELIIFASCYHKDYLMFFCSLLSMSTIFLTSFYTFRMAYHCFFVRKKFKFLGVRDCSYYIRKCLISLALLSIFSGYLFKDLFVGVGTDFWSNTIFYSIENFTQPDLEFYFTAYTFPIKLSLAGIFLPFYFLSRYFLLTKLITIGFSPLGIEVNSFFFYRWFLDYFYNLLSLRFFVFTKHRILKTFELYLEFFFGPNGLSKMILFFARKLSSFQTGKINYYVVLSIILVGFGLYFLDGNTANLFYNYERLYPLFLSIKNFFVEFVFLLFIYNCSFFFLPKKFSFHLLFFKIYFLYLDIEDYRENYKKSKLYKMFFGPN